MLGKKEQSLFDALSPKALEEGIEIVTVEIVGAKKSPTIRVYIDTPQGVSFDELSSSQVWVNEILDALDPFPGAYTLEVSSPGIDRPLRTLEHFTRFIGEVVMLQTVTPLEGRSKWTGILSGVEGDAVVLDSEGVIQKIALDEIKKARIKGSIDFSA
ncbi:MAG: ribosome maturation factor RimP [Raoultibacter sp.]